ncbi:MAG: hypothetical protein ACOVN4_09095, partial [Bosea sp. (in: a-proteobacteria)]
AGDRAAISRNLRLIEQSQLALLDGADQAHGCLAAEDAELLLTLYITVRSRAVTKGARIVGC